MNKKVLFCLTAILFILCLLLGATGNKKDLAGIWAGKLKVPGGMELRIVFKIKLDAAGELSATLDSPDQGASGILVSGITLKEYKLRLKVEVVGGEYNGIIDRGLKKIKGSWQQGGMELPLDLVKQDKAPVRMKHPQEPEKPYPYDEEEVKYENKKGGIKLAGTLTLPRVRAPFSAVILITGSGAQDRDETVMGHKRFLVLADYLTRRNIAVLRVDDRGVGGSGGSVSQSTTRDFAYDVLAGVAFLKNHPKIDNQKIGLIGHSEGGIVAPLAASLSEDIAYIVLMAGTGLTGEEIIYLQSALIARANGASEEDIKKSINQQKRAFKVVVSGRDEKSIKTELKKLFAKDIAAMEKKKKGEEKNAEKLLKTQIKRIVNPWFRYFLTYDPREALKKVRCPVLAINGEKDLQVPPRQNLQEIKKALEEGGNKNVTVKEITGVNHLFQTAKTGSPAEYAKISETISPKVLKLIGDWILKQTKSK